MRLQAHASVFKPTFRNTTWPNKGVCKTQTSQQLRFDIKTLPSFLAIVALQYTAV